MFTRRDFIGLAAACGLSHLLPAQKAGLRIGVTDWNLRQTGKLEAVELASRLGFDGVEVSLGRNAMDGKLPLDDAELIEKYLAAAKTHKVGLAGTCLDILHVNYLKVKDDPLGAKWVAAGIPITAKLNARVMLLPFFGKGALQTREEMDHVADVLKEHAPAAEKAGIKLGLENTISAEDNVRIIERIGSPAVRVYYDIGNSTNNGFDVVKEIRWLKAERICQMHLKDNPNYLGEGKIDFPAVMKAIKDIGFAGFANLETSTPSKEVEPDMKRNLGFIRKLMAS